MFSSSFFFIKKDFIAADMNTVSLISEVLEETLKLHLM